MAALLPLVDEPGSFECPAIFSSWPERSSEVSSTSASFQLDVFEGIFLVARHAAILDTRVIASRMWW